MAEEASLKFSIDSKQAEEATRRLDEMTRAAQQSNAMLAQMVAASQAQSAALAAMIDQQKKAAEGAGKLTLQVTDLAARLAIASGAIYGVIRGGEELARSIDSRVNAAIEAMTKSAEQLSKTFAGLDMRKNTNEVISGFRYLHDEAERTRRVFATLPQAYLDVQFVTERMRLSTEQAARAVSGLTEAISGMTSRGRELRGIMQSYGIDTSQLRPGQEGQVLVEFTRAAMARPATMQRNLDVMSVYGTSDPNIINGLMGDARLRRGETEVERSRRIRDEEDVRQSIRLRSQAEMMRRDTEERVLSSRASRGEWFWEKPIEWIDRRLTIFSPQNAGRARVAEAETEDALGNLSIEMNRARGGIGWFGQALLYPARAARIRIGGGLRSFAAGLGMIDVNTNVTDDADQFSEMVASWRARMQQLETELAEARRMGATASRVEGLQGQIATMQDRFPRLLGGTNDATVQQFFADRRNLAEIGQQLGGFGFGGLLAPFQRTQEAREISTLEPALRLILSQPDTPMLGTGTIPEQARQIQAIMQRQSQNRTALANPLTSGEERERLARTVRLAPTMFQGEVEQLAQERYRMTTGDLADSGRLPGDVGTKLINLLGAEVLRGRRLTEQELERNIERQIELIEKLADAYAGPGGLSERAARAAEAQIEFQRSIEGPGAVSARNRILSGAVELAGRGQAQDIEMRRGLGESYTMVRGLMAGRRALDVNLEIGADRQYGVAIEQLTELQRRGDLDPKLADTLRKLQELREQMIKLGDESANTAGKIGALQASTAVLGESRVFLGMAGMSTPERFRQERLAGVAFARYPHLPRDEALRRFMASNEPEDVRSRNDTIEAGNNLLESFSRNTIAEGGRQGAISQQTINQMGRIRGTVLEMEQALRDLRAARQADLEVMNGQIRAEERSLRVQQLRTQGIRDEILALQQRNIETSKAITELPAQIRAARGGPAEARAAELESSIQADFRTLQAGGGLMGGGFGGFRSVRPAPGGLDDHIVRAAQQHGLPPEFLRALLYTESSWDPKVISGETRSTVIRGGRRVPGAIGIAQFMPGTAAERGVDPYNPQESIYAAAGYLAELRARAGGSLVGAAVGYNAGGSRIGRPFDALPAETQNYLRRIFEEAPGTGAPGQFDAQRGLRTVEFGRRIQLGLEGQLGSQEREIEMMRAQVALPWYASPFTIGRTIGRRRAEMQFDTEVVSPGTMAGLRTLGASLGERAAGLGDTDEAYRMRDLQAAVEGVVGSLERGREQYIKFGESSQMLRQQIEDANNLRQGFMQMTQSMGSALEAVAVNGGRARDVIRALLLDIGRISWRSMVAPTINKTMMAGMEYAGSWIAQMIGSGGAPSYAAGFDPSMAFSVQSSQGHAIDRGFIVPMAAGEVVTSPRFFPLAGGKTGLMGEAGPEAIVPLVRMPGGDLGVKSAGGGGEISITVNVDGSSAAAAGQSPENTQRLGAEIGRQIESVVERVMAKHQRPRGMLNAM